MEPNNPNQQQQQHHQYNPYGQGYVPPLPAVPNATVILILGICSIVFCGLGPILGTITLFLSKQARIDFESKPGAYEANSYSNVKTGRICGIIGLCVGGLFWIFWLCYLIFFVWIFSNMSGRPFG